MKRLCRWTLGVIALAVVVTPASAAIFDVFVYDFEFSINPPPGAVVDPIINLGDTVRWNWIANLHTSTSVVGSIETWNSGLLNNGQTFSHTFTNTGTFWYYCQMHGFDNGNGTAGGMAGTVTVVPEPASLAMIALGTVGFVARSRRRKNG